MASRLKELIKRKKNILSLFTKRQRQFSVTRWGDYILNFGFSASSGINEDEMYQVKICENQAWGLHQCSSKAIPAVFKAVKNRNGLAITKELLSTDEPIYYYSYSLTLTGKCHYGRCCIGKCHYWQCFNC